MRIKMIKLRSRKLFKSCGSKLGAGGAAQGVGGTTVKGYGVTGDEIKWELRPGGMLVQRRDCKENYQGKIRIRVSTVSQWHDISVQATSTFGELKMLLSFLTNLEPREQRVLFKGKEREDNEYLHMVGVGDKDKVLLLEDPAIKERKLVQLSGIQPVQSPYRAISV